MMPEDRSSFSYEAADESATAALGAALADVLPDGCTVAWCGTLGAGKTRLVQAIAVSDYCVDYVARLIRATRPRDPSAPEFVKNLVDWGVSPRAGQYLIMAGKACAAMEGRFNVAIDDLKAVAVPALRHRIGTNFQAQAEGVTAVDVVNRLLEVVEAPAVPKYATGGRPVAAASVSPIEDDREQEPVQGSD